jgi:hypothetical protein
LKNQFSEQNTRSDFEAKQLMEKIGFLEHEGKILQGTIQELTTENRRHLDQTITLKEVSRFELQKLQDTFDAKVSELQIAANEKERNAQCGEQKLVLKLQELEKMTDSLKALHLDYEKLSSLVATRDAELGETKKTNLTLGQTVNE